jgi:hypothetical protein
MARGYAAVVKRRIAAVGGIVAACVVVLAGSAAAETRRFTAALASEVATAPKPGGRGSAILSLDTEAKIVSWTVEYSGLATPPRALGCGALDTPSGPAILVTGNLASPITGSKTLSDGESAALGSGGWACVIDTDGEEDAIGGVLQSAR